MPIPRIRRTKIVCTLGPASQSEEQILALAQAGMDVARLNFSHGDHDSHAKAIETVRRVSQRVGREIGILQDLCGPKIRLGTLGRERFLKAGERVVLVAGESAAGDELPVQYPQLAQDLKVGDRILLADGLVELRVEDKEEDRIFCRVVVEGSVSTGKGINLPTSNLQIPAFTDKDRKDLAFGLKSGVDFVALSFVRNEMDLEPLIEILNHSKRRPLLIAKLEKPEAIERLDNILAMVDGVMVARGDLGVEMPLEEVPIIQKRIIETARLAAKPVITATQMLRSMMDNPRPTRAEAADVANAVLDGTDAVMLSEESAVGNYPVEAVRTLSRIAAATEPYLDDDDFLRDKPSPLLPKSEAAITRAACWLAKDILPRAVVASTHSGSTARLLSRLRPDLPIVGLTPEISTCRQLTLSWGVVPALITSYSGVDQMFDLAKGWFLGRNMGAPGETIIVTAGVPVGVPGTTNLLKVLKL